MLFCHVQSGETFCEELIPKTLATEFVQRNYEKLKKKVMECRDSATWWIENSEASTVSFLCFIQLYSDKTSKTFKNTALVTYPMHMIIPNVATRRK